MLESLSAVRIFEGKRQPDRDPDSPDLFIRLGGEAPIMENLPLGIWACRFGVSSSDPKEAIGVREVVERNPVTSVRLNVRLNGRDIALSESHIMTDKRSIYRNRNNLYWKSVHFILGNVERLASAGPDEVFAESALEPSPSNAGSDAPFTGWRTAGFLMRHFASFVRDRLARLFFIDQWIVLVAENRLAQDMEHYREIAPPKNKAWADPFMVRRDGRHFLFVEELPDPNGKGHVSVIRTDGESFSEPAPILNLPVHLSYPFVFEYEGRHYMIPETRLNRTVALYECIEFPDKWVHKTNLMEHVDAVDTTLFYHGNVWWLFTSLLHDRDRLYASDLYYDRLFLFYSDSPFSDRWTPHPMNPVVEDVRSARPAGRVYVRHGKIIRPSQDGSVRYGYGFRLNEIIRLTPTEYEERMFEIRRPDWDKSILATHTFNRDESFTVIDAMKRRRRWF